MSASPAVPVHFLEEARATAGEARAITRRMRAAGFSARRKPDGTFVTDVDDAVERAVRDRLARAFPGHGIIGEELPPQGGAGEWTWVIDPIDGTRSLRHGLPLYGTLLALLHHGRSVLGVIDLPELDRLYVGAEGHGAWRNGEPLCLADTDHPEPLAEEIVAVGDRASFAAAGEGPLFDELLRGDLTVRTYGDCFGHAMALEGALGALLDFDLRPWDAAASEALVRATGGRLLVRRRAAADGGVRIDLLFGKPGVVSALEARLDGRLRAVGFAPA